MNIINAIMNFFSNSMKQPMMSVGYISGFNTESQDIAAKREEVILKMRANGRKTMAEGGEFSLHNTVLNKTKTLKE